MLVLHGEVDEMSAPVDHKKRLHKHIDDAGRRLMVHFQSAVPERELAPGPAMETEPAAPAEPTPANEIAPADS